MRVCDWIGDFRVANDCILRILVTGDKESANATDRTALPPSGAAGSADICAINGIGNTLDKRTRSLGILWSFPVRDLGQLIYVRVQNVNDSNVGADVEGSIRVTIP